MIPSPADVYALIADRPGSVWLDGGPEGWSILAWAPEEVVTDPRAWVGAGRRLTGPAARPASEAPFHAGCLGYVGYGAGPAVEAVRAHPSAEEPDVWLARYPGALCFHGPSGRWVATGEARRQAQARELLDRARPRPPVLRPPAPALRSIARADWLAAVRSALERIASGDCYQVNLSRLVRAEGSFDPLDLYLRLAGPHPASHGALMHLGAGLAVLSNSPERLLVVEGDRVGSTPIKGTRPRGASVEEDLALAQALALSAKDAAELWMIVDLVRNDLGRVAVAGSVQAGPRRIRALPTVFHAEVDVEARLRPGLDAWDALAALFPAGSVTGAPKIRATERIAELELEPRGVYCGSVGYVDASGRAEFSVAIRSGVVSPGGLRFHVGGGIVADSEPEAEWEETVAKALAWTRALG